jgi:SAM-dependent methyltransferase
MSAENPWLSGGAIRGDAYDDRYAAREAAGEHVHGEADFIEQTGVRSVLDAGCGTGRVARELARRGLDVAGIDLDPAMLATARERAPGLSWHLGDIATADLGRRFEAIVMAGNVMLFLTPGSEAAVLANLARQLAPGGVLIAGFQVGWELNLARYDALAAGAGLEPAGRWATWERDPWQPDSGYAVSMHRRPSGPDTEPPAPPVR